MKGIRIKILDLGYMEMERQELISGGGSGITQSPITAVLIQHPEAGWLLYDTGNDDAWETTYPAHVRETFRIKRLITIRQALAEYGVEDIFSGSRGCCQIDILKVDCDYYELLKGNPKAVRAWQMTGNYLQEYSWAEETGARLELMGHPI